MNCTDEADVEHGLDGAECSSQGADGADVSDQPSGPEPGVSDAIQGPVNTKVTTGTRPDGFDDDAIEWAHTEKGSSSSSTPADAGGAGGAHASQELYPRETPPGDVPPSMTRKGGIHI